MLVLSRYVGESIIIDGVIRVTILKFRGTKVRFGIEAPPEIAVDRQELADAKRRGGRASRPPDPDGP